MPLSLKALKLEKKETKQSIKTGHKCPNIITHQKMESSMLDLKAQMNKTPSFRLFFEHLVGVEDENGLDGREVEILYLKRKHKEKNSTKRVNKKRE